MATTTPRRTHTHRLRAWWATHERAATFYIGCGGIGSYASISITCLCCGRYLIALEAAGGAILTIWATHRLT